MDEIRWRKSTYSSNGGASCIEVAQAPHIVAVRDTKQHGRGPVLRFTPAAWRRFAEQIKGARKLGKDFFANGRAEIKSRGAPPSGSAPTPVPRCQSANVASIVSSLRAARALADLLSAAIEGGCCCFKVYFQVYPGAGGV